MLACRSTRIIGATPSNRGGAGPRTIRVPSGSRPAAPIPTVVVVTRYSRFFAAPTGALVVRSWLWGWPAIGQLILDLLLALVYGLLLLVAFIGALTTPIMLVGLPL